MEFEQLEVGKKCLLRAITWQDVADYYDILHPKVLLVSHFKYPPSPPTVSDTIPVLAQAKRRIAAAATAKASNKKGPGPKKTTIPTSVTPISAATAATMATAKKGSRATAASTGSLAREGRTRSMHLQEGGPYDVDVVEGPLLATERLYTILHWLNQGSYITDTTVEMEARKVILQESEVLPPPPPPKSEAERYAQLGRQHTDRNQRLSRLIVTFGRELLLFRDECYFEDGVIVTVHRFMLTTQEMLALAGLTNYQQQPQTQKRIEAMQEERNSFYSTKKTRVDVGDHASLPLLDFTFCDITEPLQLLRVRPVAGKRHKKRELQPALDPRVAQGVFVNQQSDPTRPQKEQRVIVKARNKQGDEEVYEFVESAKSRYGFLHDVNGHADNSLESLADKMEATYAATSVRISGCSMGSTELLVPVLRRLVVNAIMTLRSLDLSNNRISVLPDFSLLPLQRLQLHQNCISDWAQVENRVCPLPLLCAVTLHGNPIAENDPHYWQSALARLMRHPNRAVRLRQLDFVTLTGQDYNTAGAFELFETGDPRLLKASMGAAPGMNGGGAM
ncbi:hypothetical protein DQ04_08141020 [Trypanosoma grayi]|uniref:hypothetical protein n=1 Tax=Trypanosoma grayi TaxID=71804 RepID=UPI0004F48FF7|nr:hypothetical protein DQ04_08141020 [Trypanosoma grayi]KEG08047.1 hypothetical protein DQ04_08141020 [Trypanosoma grayi]